MILVDDRVGSVDLIKPLNDSGLQASKTRLEFGDVAFTGLGAADTILDIGLELKTINDLVGSLRSGRLAGHQLPGLRQTYDHTWLLVEGLWRHDTSGRLVTYQGKTRGWCPIPGRMTASELEKQVLTLELCGGLHVRYLPSRRDTIRFVGSLYHWWADTALDRHTSHLVAHTAPTIVPISDFRQTVMRFPGVGYKTSLAVEQLFGGSLRKAINASLDEWASVTTVTDKGQARRLGVKVATDIVNFCKGD